MEKGGSAKCLLSGVRGAAAGKDTARAWGGGGGYLPCGLKTPPSHGDLSQIAPKRRWLLTPCLQQGICSLEVLAAPLLTLWVTRAGSLSLLGKGSWSLCAPGWALALPGHIPCCSSVLHVNHPGAGN